MTFDSAIFRSQISIWQEVFRLLKPGGHLLSCASTTTYHRMVIAIEDVGFEIRDQIGWLSDSWMPIVLARKPLIGTVAANVLHHGVGGLNIDECRVGVEIRTNGSNERAERNGFVKGFVSGTTTEIHDYGRWPANIIHDGSVNIMDAFASYGNRGASAPVQGHETSTTGQNGIYGHFERVPGTFYSDSGSAARFFHCAKTDADLMRYLCKLMTPVGGTILAGSISIEQAAKAEGFHAVLMNMCKFMSDVR